ncbi:MAG: hypothetical protein HY307_01390 [Arcobacter sp.]|nr:hypothetical protein [Arcobacter sp.]
MALKFFLFAILLTSLFLTNITVNDKIKIDSDENLPKISFINSTLYELNKEQVNKIVKAKKAIKYENKDELEDATLVLRGSKNTTDTISGKYMKKENDIYDFKGDVVFNKGGDTELKTQSLSYNDLIGIATNNVDFVFNYKHSLFSGNTLYVNKNDVAISGKHAHFVINEKDL